MNFIMAFSRVYFSKQSSYHDMECYCRKKKKVSSTADYCKSKQFGMITAPHPQKPARVAGETAVAHPEGE
jgi:hypothetical protein